MFCVNCTNVRLLGGGLILVVDHHKDDGMVTRALPLNAVLGNIDGNFTWGGQAFTSSAEKVKLDTSHGRHYLRADLRRADGSWKPNCEVDLDGHITFESDTLKCTRVPSVIPIEKGMTEKFRDRLKDHLRTTGCRKIIGYEHIDKSITYSCEGGGGDDRVLFKAHTREAQKQVVRTISPSGLTHKLVDLETLKKSTPEVYHRFIMGEPETYVIQVDPRPSAVYLKYISSDSTFTGHALGAVKPKDLAFSLCRHTDVSFGDSLALLVTMYPKFVEGSKTTTIKDIESKMSALERGVSDREAKIAGLKSDIAKLEASVEERSKNVSDLEAAAGAAELESAKEDVTCLQKRLEGTDDKLRAAVTAQAGLESSLEKLKDDLKKMTNERDRESERAGEAAASLRRLEDENGELKEDLKKMSDQRDGDSEAAARAAAHLRRLEDDKAELSAEIAGLQAELAERAKRSEQLSTDLMQMQKQRDEALQQVDERDASIRTRDAAKTASDAQIARLQTEVKERGNTILRWKSELEEARKQLHMRDFTIRRLRAGQAADVSPSGWISVWRGWWWWLLTGVLLGEGILTRWMHHKKGQ